MQHTSTVALRLDPHPRHIDALLRFRLRFEPMFVGGVLLLIAVAIAAYFITKSDLTNHRDDVPVGHGEVIEVEEEVNRKTGAVTAYVVTARFEGASVMSRFNNVDWQPRLGEKVTIVGDGNPRHTMIAGGRLGGNPLLPLFVSGAIIVVFASSFLLHLWRTQRHLKLLEFGREGEAVFLRRKERWNKKGDDILVYEFFDGVRTRTLKNTSPGAHDQDRTEPILFDDTSAVFLESLPGLLHIEAGRFVAREPASRFEGLLALAMLPLAVLLLAAALWHGEVRTVDDLARVVLHS